MHSLILFGFNVFDGTKKCLEERNIAVSHSKKTGGQTVPTLTELDFSDRASNFVERFLRMFAGVPFARRRLNCMLTSISVDRTLADRFAKSSNRSTEQAAPSILLYVGGQRPVLFLREYQKCPRHSAIFYVKNDDLRNDNWQCLSYLDFARPVLESPSTRSLDKCRQRHANEAACKVRISDDICTTYSQISDSASNPDWFVPSIESNRRQRQNRDFSHSLTFSSAERPILPGDIVGIRPAFQ